MRVRRDGWNAITVNYRGFGDSEGGLPSKESVYKDGQAMFNHLLQMGFKPDQIVIHGYSMGGAVAVCAADEGSVEGVVALAPWLPDRLRLDPLVGRRLAVIHGGLDRSLPGVPGIRPESSRRGFERALALGVEGSYTLIPGAVHGAALRSPRGAAIPLPRARRWADAVSLELARFQASVG